MTASLAQILPQAAETLNLDVQHDRALLVKRINYARQLLFSFANAREAFARGEGQIMVTSHHPGKRESAYAAITLPPGVLTLDKLRTMGGQNITVFGEHQYQNQSQPPRKAIHMPGRVFFVVDFRCGNYVRVPHFRALDPSDYGKRMGIEYDSLIGPRREDLILGCEPVQPSMVPDRVLALTLPHDRQGWVVAEDESGLEHARYHPKVQPGFVRYALHQVSPGKELQWWGTREIHDVVFDTDPVEFADITLWDELLKFAKLKKKETRSAGEQRALMDATQFLTGQIEQALLAQQGQREHLRFRNASVDRAWNQPMNRLNDIR